MSRRVALIVGLAALLLGVAPGRAQVETASTATVSGGAPGPAAGRPPEPPRVAPPPPPPVERPDAGPPDAAPPPPALPPVPVDALVGPEPPPDAGVAEDAGAAEDAGRAAPSRAGPPARRADAGVAPDPGSAPPSPPRRLVPRSRSGTQLRRSGEILISLLLLAAILLAGVAAALMRRYLDPAGLLPRLLGSVVSITRGVGVAAVLITPLLILGYLDALGPWLLLAVLVLVGARDLVPDLVAYAVLRGERELRPGRRVSTPTVSGRIQQVGFRSTRLVDEAGRVVTVPNHLFVQGTLRAEARGWPTREVELVLPPGDGAAQRRAILDAVRMCPWVPTEAEVSVHRDSARPERWLVRAEVLDARFSERFAGELAERVAEALAASVGKQ